jgi:ribosomal protein S17E
MVAGYLTHKVMVAGYLTHKVKDAGCLTHKVRMPIVFLKGNPNV